MKLFKKPKWLKPDFDTFKYWLHALILAVVVLGVMQLFRMLVLNAAVMASLFTVKNIAILALLLGVSDIVVHTVLRYD